MWQVLVMIRQLPDSVEMQQMREWDEVVEGKMNGRRKKCVDGVRHWPLEGIVSKKNGPRSSSKVWPELIPVTPAAPSPDLFDFIRTKHSSHLLDLHQNYY